MDLGNVKKNIVDRKYKTLQDAADDVRLVWQNCMTYNADGSDFYNLAQILQKKWNDKYKKLLDDLRIKETPATATTPSAAGDTAAAAAAGATSAKATLDEKRTFAKALYKISKEDLGKILVEVEKQCPQALVRNSAEDEVEFNVDKIPGGVFHELQQFIKTCNTSSGKPKKKSSGGGGGSNKRQKN